jgi:hypothetical protein
MTGVSKQLAKNAERAIGRHPIAKQRVRGNASETELNNGTCGKALNAAKPGANLAVLLVILPEQSHQHVNVQQSGHGV